MRTNHEYRSRFRILKGGKIALVVTALAGSMTLLNAAPTTGTVTTGNATISQTSNITTITQTTNKASINWQSFSVAPTETVNFVQPSSSSVTLNRVVGVTNSLIEGTINANGQVFLLNPNGIVFSSGSSVNVGGLVASTLNMSDIDFQNGNYVLSGSSTNSVLNLGTITANSGGYVVIAGKTVSNEGLISATLGNVQLAGASKVTLNLSGNSLIKLTIDTAVLDALVENKGIIKADGGQVYLTTQALSTVLDGMVNNTGIIEANSIGTQNGQILLYAKGGTTTVDGTLSAQGGFIQLSAKDLTVAGTTAIDADSLLIAPENLVIEASGGTDLIAGNSISASAIKNALITTDVTLEALENIIVNEDIIWADPTKLTLDAGAKIYLNALIDNTNSATGGIYFHAANTTDKVVFDPTLGKVIVNNAYQLQWINQALAGKYELGSNIDASVTSSWNSGVGFNPIGNDTNQFTGSFNGLGHTISNLFINRPSTSYVGLFGYVGSGATLQNVGLINVDITGGAYVGGLIGYNTISLDNVYATGKIHGRGYYVGGLIGESHSIGKLIDNTYFVGSVTGGRYAGGLIGKYTDGSGYLKNSYAIGSLSASNIASSSLGGLIGSNLGNLQYTHADVKVSGVGGVPSNPSQYFGGLVGYNSGGIEYSYATGDVSNAFDSVGGLVGYEDVGYISNSYATGNVIGLNNYAGGLIGHSDSASLIEKSYATGDVTGQNYVGGFIGISVGDVIDKTYAAGRVSGVTHTGGFSGGDTTSGNSFITNSYWDIDSTGQTIATAGQYIGSIDGIQSVDAFTQATYTNFDFVNDWYMIDGETRPFLRSEYSTTIANDHQLQLMVMDLGADYTVTHNITYNGDMWSAKGFSSIGDSSTKFTGSLNGLGHTISNLAINKESSDNVGLFGVTDTTSTVQNIGLLNVDITAHDNVGAVVGKNLGILKDTYVTGSVSGNANVGGVAGYNDGSVSTSYSIATVAGNTLTGELVGNNNAGSITNSYSDINTFDEASFAGFDFTNTWFMVDGYTRPFLRGEYSTYITTDHQLQLMSMDLSTDYILADDIIYSGDMWSAKGFSTIGESTNKFTGSLDGNGHIISNLFINSAGDYVGLFGATDTGSTLKDFTLNNVDITGNNYVGALAGSNASIVSKVFVTGEVNGNDNTGGLLGENSGTVTKSYTSGSVNGHDNAGGLVGKNSGSIADTYSTARVNGNSKVGGLIGYSNGSVGTSYAIGKVSGSSQVGGFAGENAGTFINTLWDIDTTGRANGVGSGDSTGARGIHSSTGTIDAFNKSTYAGFDLYSPTWYMIAGESRPFLASEYSTTITNDHQLQLMNMGSSVSSYILANDIVYSGDMWSSRGFYTVDWVASFDGRGHTISNLYINRPTTDFVGLIHFVNIYGNIQDVGLINADITGRNYVGGLISTLSGDIFNSYVTGSVKGDTDVGGLVGRLASDGATVISTLSNSYSSADVSGNKNVGGLVGRSDSPDSYIFNSYATGKVTGNTNIGAIIGLNQGRIYNTYWDIDTSGLETAIGSGGLGGTTGVHSSTGIIDAFSASTYAGSPDPIVHTSSGGYLTITLDPNFDFANTWILYDGYTRPLLRTFMTNLTVTTNDATKTYDGTAYAGENGVLYSLRPNSNLLGTLDYGDNTDAGSYVFRASGLYSNQQGYAISYVDGRLTIDPKTITADYTGNNKVYDGTTTATANGSSSGIVSGDVVDFSQTALFDDKNVGTAKAVSVSGITLGGVDAGNYTVANSTATTTADITPKIINYIADNKVYDGTTTSTVNINSADIIGTEMVNVTQTSANFDDKNAGTAKTVTVDGIVLSGADSSNYVVSGTTTADITPKTITGTFVADNKIYDRTTTADATLNGSLNGVIGGDTVGVSQTSADFDDKNVGTGKTVTVYGITLDGADASNYSVASTTTTADITAKILTYVADNKVYDGTTTATGSLGDIITGDTVGFTAASASFEDKNVGIDKRVYVDGIVLNGADATNYYIDSSTLVAGNITPKTLTASYTADNKVYDATTTATTTAGTLSGVVGTDTVSFTQTSADFDNKNAGTGKTVTVNSSLSGADASNYTVASSTTTADITPKALTARYTANNKTFDGTTRATANGSSSDIISGDRVSFSQTAFFDTPDIEDGKTVHINGIALGGVDGGNYSLLNSIATATADITYDPVLKQTKTPVKNGIAFKVDDMPQQNNLADIIPFTTIVNRGVKLPLGLINNDELSMDKLITSN